MNTIYNEKQNKQSEMINDLQNLPKIVAPENFEYNLMTRINNKNFDGIKKDKPIFNWIKFLAPSAVAVTALILFFILQPSSNQTDNPLLYKAQKSDSQSIVNNSLAAGKEILNQQNPNQNTTSSITEKVINPNNQMQSINPRVPFITSRSVSLDDYISGGNNPKNLRQGNIVNGGNESTPMDRFFVAENPDQNTLKKLRAQVDSVKKAQMKADSLKKVQKMP